MWLGGGTVPKTAAVCRVGGANANEEIGIRDGPRKPDDSLVPINLPIPGSLLILLALARSIRVRYHQKM
jgi:hypothetical protein